METRERGLSEAPALVPDAPVAAPMGGGAVAQILRLQASAGNAAVARYMAANRMLARDDTPTATPAAAASTDWFDVIPYADEKTKVTATYDKAGAVTVDYSDRDAKELKKKQALAVPAAAGATPAAPADATAIDAAVTAIVANRAKLPGWAFPDKEPTTGSQGEKWRGPTGYTRYTDQAPKPKPAKKGQKPEPLPPLTAQQQAAIESAKSYRAFLDKVQADAAVVTAPKAADDGTPPSPEETKAFIDALETRMFFNVAAKEGGTDSINVYDSQVLTWGGGLGSASGQSSTAMASVAGDPTKVDGSTVGAEVTKALHDAGVAFAPMPGGRSAWVAVDTDKKLKFRDSDAAMLMKADPRLLMLLSHISRGELPGKSPAATVQPEPADGSAAPAVPDTPPTALQTAVRNSVMSAQRHYFLVQHFSGANSIGKAIETLGASWPFESLHLMIHCLWWGSGSTSWHFFEKLDGTPAAVLKAIATVPAFSGYVETSKEGATIFKAGQMATQMTHWLLGKENEVWGAPSEDKLESGAYYCDMGGGKYRKLKE